MCRSVPSAWRMVAVSTRPSPSMATSSVCRCSGMPAKRGNRLSGQRAIGAEDASIIATGRMPAWRQVRMLERLTSSVPTISGRLNGSRCFRLTLTCRAPVLMTPIRAGAADQPCRARAFAGAEAEQDAARQSAPTRLRGLVMATRPPACTAMAVVPVRISTPAFKACATFRRA